MWPERRKMVQMWRDGEAAALATLVHVDGTSYRPGARLMIGKNGDQAGSISGGCLEVDVVRRLRWLTCDGARLQLYSTAFDDTSELPYGSGCGGDVTLLLEPADTPSFELLMQALEQSLQGKPSLVRTMLPVHGAALARSVHNDAPDTSQADSGASAVLEYLKPPERLPIFGAGNDVQPLVRQAALLGWRVIVVDERVQWARLERFPEAERVLVASNASFAGVSVQPQDLAVVTTHSYEQDKRWLKMLLSTRPRYLGLLGAKHRSALLAMELAASTGRPLDEICEGLSTPVGLELGGDGAEAIALAIVAEMQACAEGKQGASRRLTSADVGAVLRRYNATCRIPA